MSKRLFSRVIEINGSKYVAIPAKFAKTHGIQSHDFIEHVIENDSVKYIPQEAE